MPSKPISPRGCGKTSTNYRCRASRWKKSSKPDSFFVCPLTSGFELLKFNMRSIMRKFAFGLLFCSSVVLFAADTAQERLSDATGVFNEIMAVPDKAVPQDLLEIGRASHRKRLLI